VNLREFREAVIAEFGPRLEHATPANVREFAVRVQAQLSERREEGRLVLEGTGSTNYEQIVKDYFAQVLELPPEIAAISLWVMALELWFAVIETEYAEILAPLFEELE